MEATQQNRNEYDTTTLPLAERAGFMVGETINTLMFNESGGKSLRVLTDVQVKREYGRDWLVVRWDRGGQTPWGTADCGFAGWLIDEQLKASLTKLAEKRAAGAAGAA